MAAVAVRGRPLVRRWRARSTTMGELCRTLRLRAGAKRRLGRRGSSCRACRCRMGVGTADT